MADDKKKEAQKGLVGCFALLVVLVSVVYDRCSSSKPAPNADQRTPEKIAEDDRKADEASIKARLDAKRASGELAPANATCSISIPKVDSKVLVFPTEESYDEFGKASASKDETAINFAAMAGFWVEKGTKCLWLKRGLLTARVRVLEGRYAGQIAWLDREWSEGRQ